MARTLVVLVLLVGAFLLGVSVGEGPSEPSTSSDPVESQIAYIKSQVDSLQTSVRSSLPAKMEEGCALAKAQGYDLCATNSTIPAGRYARDTQILASLRLL